MMKNSTYIMFTSYIVMGILFPHFGGVNLETAVLYSTDGLFAFTKTVADTVQTQVDFHLFGVIYITVRVIRP